VGDSDIERGLDAFASRKDLKGGFIEVVGADAETDTVKGNFLLCLSRFKTSTFSTWVSSRKVPVLKSLRSSDPVFLIRALTAVLPVNSSSTLRGESSREKPEATVARTARERAWTFMMAGVKRLTDVEASVDELRMVC
jgi:hypothetical protein